MCLLISEPDRVRKKICKSLELQLRKYDVKFVREISVVIAMIYGNWREIDLGQNSRKSG